MNYIRHLTGFFEKVTDDHQLNPTHISLYIALFQFWNCNRFRNPISIARDEVMRISKISSKATYHKCLRALHNSGYIKYEPSYNPFRGSHVIMFNFSDDLKPMPKHERGRQKNELASEQVIAKLNPATDQKQEPLPGLAMVPSQNIQKTENSETDETVKPAPIFFPISNDSLAGEPEEKEKSSAKKEKEIPPALSEVIDYCLENGSTADEAIKFHNYFTSIGWKVGGRTPMADWHAALRNWISNVSKYATATVTTTQAASHEKNYEEPL